MKPIHNPRFNLGAQGGARGFNTFFGAAKSTALHHKGEHVLTSHPGHYTLVPGSDTVLRKGRERKTLVINTEPQPWQKHAAKLKARAITQHRDPLERRRAREERKRALVELSAEGQLSGIGY